MLTNRFKFYSFLVIDIENIGDPESQLFFVYSKILTEVHNNLSKSKQSRKGWD